MVSLGGDWVHGWTQSTSHHVHSQRCLCTSAAHTHTYTHTYTHKKASAAPHLQPCACCAVPVRHLCLLCRLCLLCLCATCACCAVPVRHLLAQKHVQSACAPPACTKACAKCLCATCLHKSMCKVPGLKGLLCVLPWLVLLRPCVCRCLLTHCSNHCYPGPLSTTQLCCALPSTLCSLSSAGLLLREREQGGAGCMVFW